MDLDNLYTHIGEFGPRQKIYFFMLAAIYAYTPSNMIQTVYTGSTPIFSCTTENGTVLNNECPENALGNCVNVTFEQIPDSFVKDYGLICDQNFKVNLIQSIFMAGVMGGAILFGAISDGIGRLKTLFIATSGCIAFGIASSFMNSYELYAFLRFCAGFFCSGIIIPSFVLGSELIGPSKRAMCGNIFQGFFGIGIMWYSLLAWLITDWRLLTQLASSIGIIFLVSFIWIPESPRWLLIHDKTKEANKILQRFAKSNGKCLPVANIASKAAQIDKGMLFGLRQVFCNRKLCIITLIQLFSWFVNSAVYYGLTMAGEELNSTLNLYLWTGLTGLVEIPAYIATAFLIQWCGRKKPLCGFMIVGGLACAAYIFEQTIILPLIGKLAIAASFSIIFIHTSEVFPTTLRASLLGLCSCFARIGGIASPLTTFVNDYMDFGQFLLLGLLSAVSGALNLFLPETLNKPMQDTFV